MLQIRLEGDPDEAHAFLDALRTGGVAEVQVGTVKHRREGFAHVYAVVRMPDGPSVVVTAPVRVTAVQGRALPRERGAR